MLTVQQGSSLEKRVKTPHQLTCRKTEEPHRLPRTPKRLEGHNCVTCATVSNLQNPSHWERSVDSGWHAGRQDPVTVGTEGARLEFSPNFAPSTEKPRAAAASRKLQLQAGRLPCDPHPERDAGSGIKQMQPKGITQLSRAAVLAVIPGKGTVAGV